MMLANYIMKKLLAQGADDIVITVGRNNTNHIKFFNNKIAATKSWNMINLDIFMAINKRLVTTTLKEFSKKSADEITKNLIRFSKNIPKNKEYLGIADGPFKYKKILDSYDKKIMEIDGIDLVESGINTSLEQGAKRTAGVLELSEGKTLLITSNGVEAEDKGTDIYFSIRSFSDKDASGHKVGVSNTLKGIDIPKIAKESGRFAKMSLNPKDGKSGKYTVLFEPLSFANVLDNFGAGCSVFQVEAGLSCLAGKIGKRVASKNFNFYDDGRLKNGVGSALFDLEGVPTQRTHLIKDGILKTYLHNTSTAKRYGVKTTANAGLVAPEPHNLVLGKGKYKKEDMLKKIKKGIWITNIWYTRFQDHVAGDFSTIPRDGAFYIENGKIKHPVKNIRISENLINILKNVTAIGINPEQIRCWEVETPCLTPSVLVKNVNITKP